MTELTALPASTYAIIVGIETYDAGADWEIPGCASDAQRLTNWLLKQGVPPTNLYLFVASKNESLVSLRTRLPEVHLVEPTKGGFWNFLQGELTQLYERLPLHNTLFFYWQGHGLIDKKSAHRILLMRDTTDVYAPAIDLEDVQSKLLFEFPRFSEQIFFIDACASFKNIHGLESAMPGEIIKRPGEARQYTIFSAQEGQTAKAGYFSEFLLDLLDRTASSLALDLEALSQELKPRLQHKLDEAYSQGQWTSEQKIAIRIKYPGKDTGDYIYPPPKNNFLHQVTAHTLLQAQQQAAIELEELKQSSGDEYNNLMNEKALLGCLPQWHHLYLGEFGAFRRPEKEQQILTDMNTHLRKLISKQQGLILHVISGDSGCGKSTLAKQILRRLVEHEQLEDYPDLQGQKLKIFELKLAGSEQSLETEIRVSIVPDMQEEVYVIYFDDLFALEEGEIDRILSMLAAIAERVRLYFLVTSPSWVFDHKKDLQKRKLTFHLVSYVENIIRGINKADKEALKDQYKAMYGNDCREDLLDQIDREDEAIVLLKLGLHHGMTYSQYLDQLLEGLKRKEPKYLAALLLFSTLARFYIHFPVNLLQLINQELAGGKLPETPDDYETINNDGLRLFRIRKGTRTLSDPVGMPYTLAPFHDRVAQVIYTTWGKTENVPLFGCKLEELRNRVYRKLQADSQTLPILANIFRGHLRVAEDDELAFFVNYYGPVQGNNWTLREAPIAAYRWIAFSRFNPVRTEKYRRNWEQILENNIHRHEEVGLDVTLAFLNPYGFWERIDRTGLTYLKYLGADYFLLVLGVLEQLVNTNPPPLEILGDYLPCLVEWLEAHRPSTSGFYPTWYYLVITSLAGSSLMRTSFSFAKNISQSLSRIIKAYLHNLAQEYTNNEVLGSGVRTLARKIHWEQSDVTELANFLFHSLKEGEPNFSPGLMEILLQLVAIFQTIPANELFELFLDICERNATFSGLTYTAKRFGEYLSKYGSRYPNEHKQFLRALLADLTSGNLHMLMKSSAYPDFVEDLITQLIYTRLTISPSELFAMLRPLVVDFSSSPQIPYVFTRTVALNLSNTSFQDFIHDDHDRQIQLCFAQRIQLPMDQALDEFVSFLENGNFHLLHSLVILLSDYLKSKISRFPEAEKYGNLLYFWLEQHKESQEAIYVFTLLDTLAFFPSTPLKDLEDIAIKNMKLIPTQLPRRCFPFTYIKWWLLAEASNPNKQNAKIILLDTFWQQILENSEIEFKENHQVVEGKFLMYEKFFMFLLTHYPISQDEGWWLKSLSAALSYYSRLTSDILQQTTQQKQAKKEQVNEVVKKKRQRDCLDQIIDTILYQFDLDKNSLTDSTHRSLKAVFAQYLDRPWALRWISKIDAEVQSLGTEVFIDYLLKLSRQAPNVFEIRNRFEWWVNWVQEAEQDFSVELNAVLKGIEPVLKSNTLTMVLSTLIGLAKIYLPKTAHSVEIVLGSFVIMSLEQTAPEFHNASELVKNYLEYLKGYDQNEDKMLPREKPYLHQIAIWYLGEAIKRSERDFTPFGLQILFDTLAKFEIALDIHLAENAFLAVSSAHLDLEAGGAISRYYFNWLFKQSQPFSIQPYIDFIETNQKRQQASYFMFFMVEALDKYPIQLSIEQCNSYWQILKSLIRHQLSTDGTTLASEHFCSYFLKHYVDLEGSQEFLRQLSKEAFEIVQEMINHRRIFFLLPTFLPVWQASITYPPSREILSLWQTLLGRLRNNHDMEVFGTFTRNLLNSMEVGNDTSSLEEFYQLSLDFIDRNLRHKLSPKLCSTLSARRASIDKLVDILPKLMYYQVTLEDTAYAIDRFFRFCSSILEDSRRTEFESSLIEALEHNLGKPFAEKCLIEILKHCWPKVHYLEISQLFRGYLATGKEPERKEDEYEFWKVFKVYHTYEEHSELDPESIKQNLIHYLSVIQNIARKPMAARYLDAALETWSSQDVPISVATETLKAILVEVNPDRWQRIIHLCERYLTLFGESILLAPNLSIRDILSLLKVNKHEGLISLKQKLRLLT